MMEFDRERQDGSTAGNPAAQPDPLPFSVELWTEDDAVERVLGRALNAMLAQAIFRAAISEHPGRRITLRRGEDIVEDSRS